MVNIGIKFKQCSASWSAFAWLCALAEQEINFSAINISHFQ